MKRFISLLLALIMCAFAFASCSKKADKTDSEEIIANGKLVIGITEYEPMNYKDDKGEWTGFDTEFAQAFAKKLGVEAEFIIVDWDYKFAELESKSIDCIWNGMTITDEVKLNTSCSNPYVKNAQVVVMNESKKSEYKTVEDMAQLSFAVEAGSAGETEAINLKYNTIPVSDQAAALLEVSSGSADACIIDITMANAMTGEGTSYSSLGVAAELNSEEYGVGFRKDSDMTAKFNDALAEFLSDGTLDKLADKYNLTLVK